MELNNILKKVYAWMFLGLLVTFSTGYIVSISPNMIEKVFSGSIHLLLALVEIIIVIVLSAKIRSLNPTTARILFLLYSFVTGLTFASIFIVYELESVIFIFLITAIVFGILSLIGTTINADLSKLGTILFVALIGIIISIIINLIIGSSMFEMIISIISLMVFLGFTIYDTKKIYTLANYYDEDSLSIIGALELYLDFINIFIDLLRFFGNRKD